MFKTRITEMLGIEYPLFMGGMQWLSTAEFVAPAAEAGIMAFLTAETFQSAEELRAEIRKTRGMTDRPFGVNISMLPEVAKGGEERSVNFARVAAEEGVAAVETAGRDPSFLVPILNEAGIKIFHKAPAIRYAKKAVAGGVDGIIILGYECGGHPGMFDIPIMVILPRAVDELNVPIIAAGGIADARGFAAALAMGADGVLMGTRFAATRESTMHENFKQKYVEATELDTVHIMRSLRNPLRCYRNSAVEKVLDMEARSATLEELLTIVGGKKGRAAYEAGDWERAPFPCSQAVGMIHEIKTIKEVVTEIIEGAHKILSNLRSLEQK